MIKYISENSGSSALICIDTETHEVITSERIYHEIDWVWIAPISGELNGNVVEKGDVIIRCYGIKGGNRQYFIIKDDAFKEYYTKLNLAREEDKKCSDCCCDSNCVKSC